MTTTLATLAAEAVSAYIDACGKLMLPTEDGLLATEAANARTWAAEGYVWADVREALTAAWTAR